MPSAAVDITSSNTMTDDERDDRILAELHELQAEIRRIKTVALTPRHGIFRLFIKDLETNPHAQYSVHKWGSFYWLLNLPAVALVFFFAQAIWLKWGVFVILEYSIYANLATDYGAMSAAMAAYSDHQLPPIPAEPAVIVPVSPKIKRWRRKQHVDSAAHDEHH
jgi:hypothetical protein